jgi:hypothetical protein
MRQAWKVYHEVGKVESHDGGDDRSAVFWQGKLRHDVAELAGRLLRAPHGAKTGVSEREEDELKRARRLV